MRGQMRGQMSMELWWVDVSDPFLTDGIPEVQVSSGSGHADFHENYHVCK